MPDAIKKPGAAISEVFAPKVQNRYSAIIAKVFANHYGKQGESFEFTRDEFAGIAAVAAGAIMQRFGRSGNADGFELQTPCLQPIQT